MIDPELIHVGNTYRVHIGGDPTIAFDFTVLISQRQSLSKGIISNATPMAIVYGWNNGDVSEVIRYNEFVEEVFRSDGLWIEEIPL